jgi:hypothetical protein
MTLQRFRLWTIRHWARFSAIMATLAPETIAETKPRGRPETQKTMIRAGSVVLQDRALAVVVRAAGDDWLGFQVRTQTGPLHRRHVILSPSEAESAMPLFDRVGRLIVRTDEPLLVTSRASVVGHLDEFLLRRVSIALQRDLHTSTLEGATHGFA